MITIEHDPAGYIVVRASDTLTKADYGAAVPELELAMETAGPLRALIMLEDFRGWEAGALWEEVRFDARHGDDFARIAVVGESRLEQWGSRLSQLFFTAEVRFFDRSRLTEAKAWLLG